MQAERVRKDVGWQKFKNFRRMMTEGMSNVLLHKIATPICMILSLVRMEE